MKHWRKWPRACRIMALAALAMFIVAGLAACRRARIEDEPPLDLSLQQIEFVEMYYNPNLKGTVAVDRQTNVMYWFSPEGAATLLVDAEGKPRVWRDRP